MKIEFKYTSGIINLPSGVSESAVRADESALRVLLALFDFMPYLSSMDSHIGALADKCSLSVNQVVSALEFWQREGILSIDGSVPSVAVATQNNAQNMRPTYTGKQIAEFTSNNKRLHSLFTACQSVLGKDFTTPDYNEIINLVDYYHFEHEYILLLLAHCVSIEKTGWAYIRKTAKCLWDEGIDTYEKLELHFEARHNKRSLEYKIRKLFGIGEREFIKAEHEIFDKWLEQRLSFKLIEKAYEITVEKTGSASLKYCNAILANWLTAGIHTPEEAEKALAQHASQQKDKMSSFDTEEMFELSLRRSEEKMKERRRNR